METGLWLRSVVIPIIIMSILVYDMIYILNVFIEFLWRAPEMLRDDEKLPAREGDIYSAGIVIYEILTRNMPFEHKSLNTEGRMVYLIGKLNNFIKQMEKDFLHHDGIDII